MLTDTVLAGKLLCHVVCSFLSTTGVVSIFGTSDAIDAVTNWRGRRLKPLAQTAIDTAAARITRRLPGGAGAPFVVQDQEAVVEQAIMLLSTAKVSNETLAQDIIGRADDDDRAAAQHFNETYGFDEPRKSDAEAARVVARVRKSIEEHRHLGRVHSTHYEHSLIVLQAAFAALLDSHAFFAEADPDVKRQTLAGIAALDKKLEAALARLPEEAAPPLTLRPAPTEKSHHFSSRTLPVIGREAEEGVLRRFADDTPGFRWMQLAGVAGQGKSRLALDLAADLVERDPPWLAGFLKPTDEALGRFVEMCGRFQPTPPTLIVVDYVVGHAEAVGTMMRTLASRREAFDQPVRVLLVERQRWDRGSLEKPAEDRAEDGRSGIGLSAGEGRADWYVTVSGGRSDGDADVEETRADPGVVELEKL